MDEQCYRRIVLHKERLGRKVCILLGMVFLFGCFCFADQSVTIETRQEHDFTYYPWVSALSLGPPQRFEKIDENLEKIGRKFRVAITTSEIYNQVYVEEIVFGEEGCCIHIASIRLLELEQMLLPLNVGRNAIVGFTLLEWMSPTEFVFTISKGTRYIASHIDQEHVKITEYIEE